MASSDPVDGAGQADTNPLLEPGWRETTNPVDGVNLHVADTG